MIAKLAFKIWGKDFHRALAANEMRGPGRENMSFAFSGPDGHRYDSWSDFANLPPIRLKRIEESLTWADAKITKTSLEQLDKDINAQLVRVIKAKKEEERSSEAAKISVLMKESLLRSSHVIPEELYYQIAATCIVRDDENPKAFDEPIHEQKTAMLRAAGQAGATFFTQVPPLRQLLGAWLTSEAGFRELLINWTMARERASVVRKVLGFEKGSARNGSTSTNSPSALRETTSEAITT